MAADFESVPELPPKSKMLRYLFLLLVLGLAICFLLPRFAVMEHALQLVSKLIVPFVILSLAAQVLSYLGSGYLLRAVADPDAKSISIARGALVTVGANSVGTLGGGVLGTAGMTYFFLRRRGVNSGAAGLGAWLPIYLNDATLAAISLAGLLVLILLKKSSGFLVAGFTLAGLTLGAGMAALFWSLSHREKMQQVAAVIMGFVAKFRRRKPDHFKIETAVGHLLEGWDLLVRGGWRAPALGAILNIAFDLLTLGLLFRAAGCYVGLAVLVAGYGLPQLLGKMTVILGGVGVVESGMVGLYTVLNVPKASVIVAVLGYRLISFWLPTLIGIALVPYLARSSSGERFQS